MITPRRRWRALLGGAALAWVLPGAAAGQTTAAASQLLHVAPIAFLPANNAAGYVVEQGGLGRLCSHKGAGYFVAPLQLPDGAVIERVAMLLVDTNRDALGLMSLVRREPERFEVLAISPVSAGTTELETLASADISAPVIDNERYTYLLQVLLTGPGVCLYDAQVTYRSR
ncbi:MAG: hypothetical protein HY699_02945 [Deltaproteobacteria bacterium]|nr:hypothetical protein [Deltaproteobacteria bacterium]